MDGDLEGQQGPTGNVEGFEVDAVFGPAMLPEKGFESWIRQVDQIEPAKKAEKERYSEGTTPMVESAGNP